MQRAVRRAQPVGALIRSAAVHAVLVVVCAMALAGCWRVRVRAQVLAGNGAAWAAAASGNDRNERTLGVGALVDEGERVRTGRAAGIGAAEKDANDAEVEPVDPPEPLAVSLLPGLDVALEWESTMDVQSLSLEKRVDAITEREAAIIFRRGALLVSVAAPEGTAPARLVVETPAGPLRAGAGSLFGIWAENADGGAGGKIRVVCARGEIQWTGQPLHAGKFLETAVSQAPTASSPAAALPVTTGDTAADAVGQRQIARLRAAERNLERLELLRQEAPPAWRR